jgi:hypothetical protein
MCLYLANMGASWMALMVAPTLETQGRIGIKVAQELSKEGIAPSTRPVFIAEPCQSNQDVLGRITKETNPEDFLRAAQSSLKRGQNPPPSAPPMPPDMR